MEMTMDIDESIKELSKWRKDLNYDRGDYCYGGTATKHSLDVAIDAMCKYKKIKQILKEPCIIPEGCYPMLKRIKREVEDEKGD